MAEVLREKATAEARGRQIRFRRRLGMALVAFLLLVMIDWLLPRRYEITTTAAVGVIELYRSTISPRLEGRVDCRFEPTCSAYGLEVIRRDGAFIGGARTAARIARCGPWTPDGTYDPP